MGYLDQGVWRTGWYKPDAKGQFVREQSRFRSRISTDGSTPFAPASRRYHLYVSYACPWAHRTLILRELLGLKAHISVSVVDWYMGPDGWRFKQTTPGATPDHLFGSQYLWQVYTRAQADYSGRVTVPILWDTQTQTIVNNESREIMQILDQDLATLGNGASFYPDTLRDAIEQTLDAIYHPINNGVYRAGFATTQSAYHEALEELFAALEHWDQVLGEQRYLCGDQVTAADWAMFTTLLRFDAVYYTHFKCNLRHVYEFPQLWGYLRELYQFPGVAETCHFDHIKGHYFVSHDHINPSGIVPDGPRLDLLSPHGRGD
ncbi:MAG: glutathione S-transferase family protein [Candidatus Sericytochromatia bacterium]